MDVVDVDAGGPHALARLRIGTVVQWGRTSNWIKGPPDGLDEVVAIAAGNSHNLTLRPDGRVLAGGRVLGQRGLPL